MGIIKVEKIHLFSNHGCLDEEAKIGDAYEVTLEVEANLKLAAQTDALADTVDYVLLNKIVKEEVAIRSKLLETVVLRILNRILKEVPLVNKATVALSKINPPIGGNVARVSIEMTLERS